MKEQEKREQRRQKIIGLTLISGTSKGTIDHPNVDRLISYIEKEITQEVDRATKEVMTGLKQWKSFSNQWQRKAEKNKKLADTRTKALVKVKKDLQQKTKTIESLEEEVREYESGSMFSVAQAVEVNKMVAGKTKQLKEENEQCAQHLEQGILLKDYADSMRELQSLTEEVKKYQLMANSPAWKTIETLEAKVKELENFIDVNEKTEEAYDELAAKGVQDLLNQIKSLNEKIKELEELNDTCDFPHCAENAGLELQQLKEENERLKANRKRDLEYVFESFEQGRSFNDQLNEYDS